MTGLCVPSSLDSGLISIENNYFTEMCSGSEAGSHVRLIDCVYHSTLDLRVIKKKEGLIERCRWVRWARFGRRELRLSLSLTHTHTHTYTPLSLASSLTHSLTLSLSLSGGCGGCGAGGGRCSVGRGCAPLTLHPKPCTLHPEPWSAQDSVMSCASNTQPAVVMRMATTGSAGWGGGVGTASRGGAGGCRGCWRLQFVLLHQHELINSCWWIHFGNFRCGFSLVMSVGYQASTAKVLNPNPRI